VQHYGKSLLLKKSQKDKMPFSNLNQPKVFTIGLVWESPHPLSDEIKKQFKLIQKRINLRHLFQDSGIDAPYKLKGMICYYGKHYNAYFYNEMKQIWCLFDDAMVKEVGDTWKGVKKKCILGHFQPSILFYQQDDVLSKITQNQSKNISLPFPKGWEKKLELAIPQFNKSIYLKQVTGEPERIETFDPKGNPIIIEKTIYSIETLVDGRDSIDSTITGVTTASDEKRPNTCRESEASKISSTDEIVRSGSMSDRAVNYTSLQKSKDNRGKVHVSFPVGRSAEGKHSKNKSIEEAQKQPWRP